MSPLAIDHIIVPLDGSSLAEVTLPPAIALAGRLHARITLLHVLERKAPATVHRDRHLRAVPEADAYLEEIAERISAAGIPVEHHAHDNPEDDVAASIAEHGRELGASLLVLCTHGQGGPRHWFTGSLAQQVIRRAHAPVVLVRPNGTPFAPRSVVVALDGTAAGETILPAALTLATGFDTEIHLVVTVPTLGTVSGDRTATALLTPTATTAALDMEATTAASYVNDVAARLRDAGVALVHADVPRGDAVQRVLEIADQHPGSVLALATHGRGAFDALWAASVGSRVVGRSIGPMLLVHPERDRDR